METSAQLFELVHAGNLEELEKHPSAILVNARDDHGLTLLHAAIAFRQNRVARYLLANGAKVDSEDRRGRTPLHYAASYQNAEIAAELIEIGCAINHKDSMGNTPLWEAIASSRKSYDLVKLISDSGGDADLENNAGLSAMKFAESCSNPALSGALKKG